MAGAQRPVVTVAADVGVDPTARTRLETDAVALPADIEMGAGLGTGAVGAQPLVPSPSTRPSTMWWRPWAQTPHQASPGAHDRPWRRAARLHGAQSACTRR